ncbi:MAG: hypothetical protein NT066_00925, partial [Candidatus Omnitrophica bacterium]|nr:hypothetical protein [Candidatus Omnitrophota bacterium]
MEKVKKKRGQVLILAYFTITFFLILSLPLFHKIISENLIIVRQRLEKEAFYLTEGAVEEAINKFISAIANFQVLPTVSRYPETGTIITTYVDSPDLPAGIHVDSVITALEPNQRVITDPDGTSVAVKTYMVSSTCQHPLNNSVTVTINQVIILRLIYTFQHAVFYADDLEILPGSDMTFTGRIHGNKDIYLNSDGNTLTINSEYLQSAANIYNRTKDGRIMDGDVKIKKLGTGSYAEMDGLDSDSPDWLTESQSRWKGTVKSSAHGITKLSTPVVGSIQPDGYYASNADVKIEDGVIKQGGVILVEGAVIPVGTVVTDDDCYNNIEEKFIHMTNIDLKKMAGY